MAYDDDDESLAEAEVKIYLFSAFVCFTFFVEKWCHTLLQEDGSLPDRDQVRVHGLLYIFTLISYKLASLRNSKLIPCHTGSKTTFSFIAPSWIGGRRRWCRHCIYSSIFINIYVTLLALLPLFFRGLFSLSWINFRWIKNEVFTFFYIAILISCDHRMMT